MFHHMAAVRAGCAKHVVAFPTGHLHSHSLKRTPEGRAPLALNKRSLVLENGQCLLQALDLSVAPPFPFLVRLRLGDATLLELAIKIKDSAQLSVRRLAVRGILRHSAVLRLR